MSQRPPGRYILVFFSAVFRDLAAHPQYNVPCLVVTVDCFILAIVVCGSLRHPVAHCKCKPPPHN